MLKNRKLSKAIGSVAWGEFIRQLKYKCSWYGKNLLQCSRWASTSKTCSQCGEVKADLSLKERVFVCACGARIDRDLNASLSIVDYAFRDPYPEETGNFKPVEIKALALAGAA
jgi:putative transposase